MYSLRRGLFPLALAVGAGTASMVPSAPLSGGACVAAGLAVGGLPARVLVGIGIGGLAVGLRSEAVEVTEFEAGVPLVVRGDLGPGLGRDRWGQERQMLRLRSLRQRNLVRAGRLSVEVRSQAAVAPGPVRLKGRLKRRADGRWMLALKDRRLAQAEPGPAGIDALRSLRLGLREYVDERLRKLLPDSQRRGLLRSMFLGRGRELDPRLQTTFRRLGLGHLFAVSGLHVGILATTAWLLACGAAGGLGWRRRLAVMVLVLGYALILDPRGSVIRATTVLLLWQTVEMLGRRLDPLPTLCTCVAALVIAAPEWAHDLGLQLSILAVLGILTLGVSFARRLAPTWGWIGGLVAIGLSAQAATIPLLAARFHWLAPLAPLYGVLAIPWAALILTLTTVAVLAPLPLPLLRTVGSAIDGLLGVGVWLQDLPPQRFDGWPVTPGDGALYALGVIVLLVAWGHGADWPSRWRRALLGPGLAAVVVALSPSVVEDSRLVMLDVGQGDAFLVQKRGASLLIDGGADGQRLLSELAQHGVRRIDALVVTHPDRDHCGGSVEIARWMRVGALWTTSGWRRACYWRLLTLPGVPLRSLWAGQSRTWRGLHFDVLAPAPGGTRRDNDDSLVMHLTSGSRRSVLLTGDIEFRGERKLLRNAGCRQLAAEVLKVAHHGGRSSTRSELLDCVRPQVALISSGVDNPFGHPVPEVLERLVAAGARIRRSDREGSVALDLD